MSDRETAELARLATLLRELERRKQQELFFNMFPDEDGEYLGDPMFAREKYQKHLEFFEAGAKFRERCAMAANRCITPWTYLETPSGLGLSAEVWTSEDARVLGWGDGSQRVDQASHGILKCIEPAFRVVLDNGQFFDCTRKHRVLSREGWISLDQLVFRSNGLRLWYKREGYQASCDAGGYLGDQPLRSLGGIDLTEPRQQGGVQKRAPFLFERTDEVAHILQRNHAYLAPGRFSNRSDLRRFSALFSLFSGASTSQPVLQLSENIQSVLRFLSASTAQPQQASEAPSGQFFERSIPEFDQMGCCDGPYSRIAHDTTRQCGALYHDDQRLGGSVQELFRDGEYIAIFYPCVSPSLIGGRRVASIVPLGLQPIIDATVKKYSNYKAGGVFHHNTGKTLGMGGFETAAHLTGLYPDWWPGRRFDRPISAWAAGKTNETTRDIVQTTLLGEIAQRNGRKGFAGCGVIPGETLGKVAWKQGVQDLADTIKVRHVSGGQSTLGFKSYQQGRGSFEGTAQHLIWLDEEPPLDVYGECLIRTATTQGLIMLTFTPLEGMSETVMQFMPRNEE